MSTFQFTTADPAHPNSQALADSDIDALELLVDADVLLDGDEGNVEVIEDEPVEDYEPEGPG